MLQSYINELHVLLLSERPPPRFLPRTLDSHPPPQEGEKSGLGSLALTPEQMGSAILPCFLLLPILSYR